MRRNAEKKNLEKCLMNTIFQGREKRMGKIEGIKIQNYGVLKNIVLGKTRTN